jgi:hypothetical protein
MQKHQVLTALHLAQVPHYRRVAIAPGERREGFLWQLVGLDQVGFLLGRARRRLDPRAKSVDRHTAICKALTVQDNRVREDRITQLG